MYTVAKALSAAQGMHGFLADKTNYAPGDDMRLCVQYLVIC